MIPHNFLYYYCQCFHPDHKPLLFMKSALLLIFSFLLVISVTCAQNEQDTVYYDQDLNVVSGQSHSYVAVRVKNDSGYCEKAFLRNGGLYKERCFVTKGKFPLLTGQFLKYDSTGNIEYKWSFLSGKQSGEQLNYYSAGNLYFSENYEDGKEHGKRMVFYEDGSLKREEVFEMGEFLSGECYTQDGKDTAYFPFRTYPSFPGGEEARISFLIKNIRYPAKARRKDLQGVVYLTFIVNKSGSVEQVAILQGVNPLLDEEAMRVVRKMPEWEPGTQDGEPVSVRFNMPVKFTIR